MQLCLSCCSLEGLDRDEQIALRFAQLAPTFNERTLRLFAAAEANAIGYGGVSRLSRITGLCRPTIEKGQRELREPYALSDRRIRRSGGGRKKTCEVDDTLLSDLENMVEPLARGDPMSPLRWTCKSTRALASALVERGHASSQRMVNDFPKSWSGTYFTVLAIAFRRTARPRRGTSIPTATRNSSTSTCGCPARFVQAHR
jgi:hypothetical protein